MKTFFLKLKTTILNTKYHPPTPPPDIKATPPGVVPPTLGNNVIDKDDMYRERNKERLRRMILRTSQCVASPLYML